MRSSYSKVQGAPSWTRRLMRSIMPDDLPWKKGGDGLSPCMWRSSDTRGGVGTVAVTPSMSRRAASATHRIVIGVHGSKNANAAWDWAAAQSQAALAFFDPWTPITIRCVALAALLLIFGVNATDTQNT